MTRTDRPSQPEDLERFLRTRLKVGLLDALFSPDIAQGFKQLYSGTIDESVAQMFKEITTVRVMVVGFIERFNRVKTAADAETSRIRNDYVKFWDDLRKSSSSIASMSEFRDLQKFEPGKIFEKMESLHSNIKRLIEKLKEESLTREISEAIDKANQLSGIKNKLRQQQSVASDISRLSDVRSDYRRLRGWVSATNNVTKVEDPVKAVPRLKDAAIQSQIDAILSGLTKAKKANTEASRLARKEKVRIQDLPVILKETRRIAKLLSKKITVGNEIAASLTKVSGKVYAVLPFKLLSEDRSFAEISRQPIPKGNREQKDKYLRYLREQIRQFRITYELANTSSELFERFAQHGKEALQAQVDSLDRKSKTIDARVEKWSNELSSASSSFVGKKIPSKKVKTTATLGSYVESIGRLITKSESRYLRNIKGVLGGVNVAITRLDPSDLGQASEQVRKQKAELPQSQEAERLLAERKVSWQKLGEAYLDYSQIPSIADEASIILQAILAKCFDETKLKDSIAGTYNEIISLMHERRLIQAIAEVSAGRLKPVVKYKNKIISHPAGSEKAFFSLAILTALARYFQTPVLIDEVANNLDPGNLRAFFELAKEFKDRYGIQYVLSIKHTNDFDLDGWVKDMRDDLAIYEVSEKNIAPVTLSLKG